MFKHDTKKKISIYILYGSQLGYSLSVAEHLYELIEDKVKPLKIEFQSLNEIIENDKIGEIHSTFVNRIRGQSSVTLRLIIESFLGLIRLFFVTKFFKN